MKRRLALAAAGVVALGVGVVVGWRRPAGGGGNDADPVAAFWSRRFATPDGGSLAMADLHGKPLLLNLWATWCPPCVREMPMLDAFAASHPGWNVLALAVDAVEPVQRFVRERKVERMRIALAKDEGPELARSLGNAAGGLPFSLRFDASGALLEKHLGALDDTVLARWSKAGSAGQ